MKIERRGMIGFTNHMLSLAGGRAGWLSGTALGGIGAAAALTLPQLALANPTDGHVTSGNVNIVTVSPNQLDIVQSSKKAIINWGDFSIGSGETTNFLQPGRNSWTLNRVTGGNPSEILGSLNANGNVLLLNQNGILFGPNSKIDVGGLVASTGNIKDTDFLNDRFRFEDAPQGSTVINQGHITVAEGGLAALVAPGVANSGVIEAKLGHVSLASGTAFTLDLYGDGLVSLALNGEVTQAPVGPDGNPLPALVTNDGRITADGGRVLLTAEAAKGVVDSVINSSGVIEARSVTRDSTGTIVLAGGENGVVEVSGTLDASGAIAGVIGGDVQVTGDLVWLKNGANIDASGTAGGGNIRVGGDFHGAGVIPNARRTLVESGASLTADATGKGNGGTVVVWADEATAFYGKLTAKGGAAGGNGGNAEISGKGNLAFDGTVDLTAVAGKVGSVLFDPRNVTIASSGPAALTNVDMFSDTPSTDLTIAASAINNANANVTVQANQNITFNAAISTGDAFSYKFQAGQGIVLNADITTNGGAVTLIARDPGAVSFTPDTSVTAVGITGSGNITTHGGAITLTVLNPGGINLTGALDSSNSNGAGGAISLTAMLGAITLANNISSRGGDAAGGSNAKGGDGGSITITAADSTTFKAGEFGTLSTSGGAGDGTGAGGQGGNITINGPVISDAGNNLFLQAQGGTGGATGNGGDGGAVAFDSQVTVAALTILVSGGGGTTAGAAGKVTTAGLTTTSTGAGFGKINISADGTVGGMGSGTVTVGGDIVTSANGVGINAAGAVHLQDVTTTANGTGNNAGGVTVMAGGDVTVGFIDTHDNDRFIIVGDGLAGGKVMLTGTNVTVAGVRTTGADGSGSNANGGIGGDIMVTATASNGKIDFGGPVNASGGLRGGSGGTNGAGGTIMLTADSVTLNQTTTTGALDLHAPTVRLEGALSFGSLTSLPITTVEVGAATATSTAGSIQAAIDLAAVDATIMLDAGTFHERGILLDKRVNIVGAGSTAMSGSIIDASGTSGFTGRGNVLDGLTVTVGGADAMNPLSLQGFSVANAVRDGIALDRGAMTNTISFIALSNVAARMNGEDGLAITGAGTVTDLALTSVTLTDNTGDGLHVVGGKIAPASGVTDSFGMFIGNSIIASNKNDGILIEADASGMTPMRAKVTDLTINGSTVAENSGDGVFITESDVSDFAIQNSQLGSTAIFAGNGGDGFDAEGSILTGAAFIGSSFNGNGQNGVNIANSSVDDVSIDGGTTINDNDDGGIRITASAVAGTNGSILFGNATITDNVTGIMVESADATAPLLLTFGSTTISGGNDGLVLSGAGIALTGGGGALPSGITVGGGMAPGDGKFGGSLGTLAFSGQSGDFIRLENGALFEPGEPTVIDASQVTFDGVAGGKLTNTERQGVMDKIVDFKDDMSLGLISLLPTPAPVTTPTTLPPPAQNPGIIPGLPGKQNTPGDTLFSLTGGLEFNPAPGVANSFCFAYSLADPTATGSEENETCIDLGPSPAHVTPNQDLRNFWRGWQAARL